MRLLETTTLTLEFFFGEIPEYAILSHRWEDEEVVYEDIRNGVTKEVEAMKGFPKVRGSCRLARQEGYKYIWIDTCCIDKSSSAELSESINSMFDWYRTAAVCYAYLSDAVDLVQFPNSLWFTRGWTLQELIAPSEVVFYNPYWMELGSRSELRETIEFVTGIPTAILLREVEKVGVCFSCNQGALGFVLTGPNVMPCNHNQDDQTLARALDSCSIAQRLSWASRRRTTRPEDTAYSLLGIFGVNMPLLYGEGTRAFLRLQEEIIKTSNDQSILAFTRSGPEWPFKGNDSLLAQSPHLFAELGNIVPTKWAANVLMTLTAKAIETTLLMCPLSRKRGTREDTHNSYHLGILHCEDSQKTPTLPALILEPVDEGNLVFRRVHGYKEIRISPEQEKILLGRGMITSLFPLELHPHLDKVAPVKISLLLFSTASAPPRPEMGRPLPLLRITRNHGGVYGRYPIGESGMSIFPKDATSVGLREIHEEALGGYQLLGWVETSVHKGTNRSKIIVLFGSTTAYTDYGGKWCRILPADGNWGATDGSADDEMKLEICKEYLAGLDSKLGHMILSHVSEMDIAMGGTGCKVRASIDSENFLNRYPFIHLKLS